MVSSTFQTQQPTTPSVTFEIPLQGQLGISTENHLKLSDDDPTMEQRNGKVVS